MIEDTMEYRGFVAVRRPSGLSSDDVDSILEWLERRHDEMGPVGGGGDRDAVDFVLSIDRPSPAEAVAAMVAAVSDAIEAAGVDGAYPSRVELERVEDRETAAL